MAKPTTRGYERELKNEGFFAEDLLGEEWMNQTNQVRETQDQASKDKQSSDRKGNPQLCDNRPTINYSHEYHILSILGTIDQNHLTCSTNRDQSRGVIGILIQLNEQVEFRSKSRSNARGGCTRTIRANPCSNT